MFIPESNQLSRCHVMPRLVTAELLARRRRLRPRSKSKPLMAVMTAGGAWNSFFFFSSSFSNTPPFFSVPFPFQEEPFPSGEEGSEEESPKNSTRPQFSKPGTSSVAKLPPTMPPPTIPAPIPVPVEEEEEEEEVEDEDDEEDDGKATQLTVAPRRSTSLHVSRCSLNLKGLMAVA